jgi:hypothetical protein
LVAQVIKEAQDSLAVLDIQVVLGLLDQLVLVMVEVQVTQVVLDLLEVWGIVDQLAIQDQLAD